MESNNQDNFLKQFGTIDSLSCYGLEKKKNTSCGCKGQKELETSWKRALQEVESEMRIGSQHTVNEAFDTIQAARCVDTPCRWALQTEN
jgi:hypothetical protein